MRHAVRMHVFVDESERQIYQVCAVFVRGGDVSRVRSEVRRLCKPGQRRVHFSKEGPSRRREILSALVKLDLQARVYTSPAAVRESRELCITALVEDIIAMGAVRLVLEGRETMDHVDDAVIKAVQQQQGDRNDACTEFGSVSHGITTRRSRRFRPDWCGARCP